LGTEQEALLALLRSATSTVGSYMISSFVFAGVLVHGSCFEAIIFSDVSALVHGGNVFVIASTVGVIHQA
jgi:hypothetical protein